MKYFPLGTPALLLAPALSVSAYAESRTEADSEASAK